MSMEPFDPNQEEGNSWIPIPVGEYVAEIIEASIAPPNSGDGYALSLVWKIIEGPQEGRQIWQQLCYLHSKEQTQTIARKTIKDICTALGINEAVSNTSVFLFKPARIRVGIQKDKSGQYDDRNKVARVMPLTATDAAKPDNGADKPSETAKPAPAPRTQGTPRPGPAGNAPWHNKR
jgi:hypothetical protein